MITITLMVLAYVFTYLFAAYFHQHPNKPYTKKTAYRDVALFIGMVVFTTIAMFEAGVI